ncbi:MAG: RluA family pseudouridine synthase, partial [Candidatus Binatia bacterium]
LARRRVRKTYLALVTAAPEPPEGEIATALSEGRLRTTPSPEGKEALTRYRLVEKLPRAALLEVEPLTGRMHQIRVHLASIGHPVLGDPTYGATGTVKAPRLFLHAARIELPHPEGGRPLTIECPLPPDWFVFAGDGPVQRQGRGSLPEGS